MTETTDKASEDTARPNIYDKLALLSDKGLEHLIAELEAGKPLQQICEEAKSERSRRKAIA